ncbi:putative WRKY transcription factor 70 [Abeliophyllum distichum]|uniref:WRKY transcription factor 70 n=1 Tax=Abeliophyllum distichum TaxID=126358 RepID=A0ABD1QT21_9LAMI
MEFSSGRKRVIDELTRGRELINDVRVMVSRSGGGAFEQPLDEWLLEKILDAYNDCLSIISSTESDEVSQVPAMNCDGFFLKVARLLCRKIGEDATREGRN